MRLYNDLIWLWPIISPHEDYLDEGGFFIQKIKEYGDPGIRTILNLGSGAGDIDWVMKKKFEMTGIDISPAMMELARKLNPEVEYIMDDMRTARLDRKFDAVVLHDAVAHMQTEEELRAAFLTAYEHLDKGGLFITFVEEWAEHFEQNHTVIRNFKKDKLEVTYIENVYDPNRSDSTYECTFVYLIRRDGFPDIKTDRMVLGIFPLAKWGELMREIGFEVTQIESPLANLADGQDDEIYPVLIGIKR
jgi:SAM-dependent methyltransferase